MCFSLGWLQQLLIWIVIVGAVVAVLQLFVPWVISQSGVFGGAINVILQVIKIIVWAIVAIFVIYVVFDLLSCFLGHSGGFPRLRN
jgi:hypothetical protein